MSEYEKADVLERTLAVIANIDAISIQPKKKMDKVKSPWMTFISTFVERKFIPGFAAALLLITTGGVSLAAEGSLPGDSLYGMKLKVNEELKSFIAVTPEAKAKFAVETTEKRLQEAALLSASGKLTEKNKSVLKTELAKRATDVKNRVAALVSQNKLDSAQEIALDFESSLRAHEIILGKITERATTSLSSITQIDELIADIRLEIATTSESILLIKEKQVNAADVRLQAEDKFKTIKLKLSLAVFTKDTALTITPEASSTFATKIEEASTTFATAEVLIDEGKYSEALTQLYTVERLIIEAESAIEAEKLVGKDIVNVLLLSPMASSTATSTATTTASTTSEVATSSTSTTMNSNVTATNQ